MRKLFTFLNIIIVFGIFGCSNTEIENSFLLVEKDNIEITSEEIQLEISVNASETWSVSSNQDWCKIMNISADKLVLKVEKNEVEEIRKALITVSIKSESKTISIAQEAVVDSNHEETYTNFDIFTDRSNSQLKPDIPLAQINQMPEGLLKTVALSLHNNNYEGAEFRIGQYEPYMPVSELKNQLNTARNYCQFENPTGIRISKNQEITVYAEGIGSENVQVLLANFGTTEDQNPYRISNEYKHDLKDGVNTFKSSIDGYIYISYYTTNFQSASKPTIHIPSGEVCGYFDLKKHDNNKWIELLDMPYEMLDIVGDRIILCYERAILKEYCPVNGVELATVSDEIITEQQELMGLKKYNKMPKNHMFAASSPYANNPFAGGQGIRVPAKRSHLWISLWTKPYADNGWGFYHENGHINVQTSFQWTGMTEVCNNLFSCWNEYLHEAPDNHRFDVNKEDGGDGLGKVAAGQYNMYINEIINTEGQDWNSYAFNASSGRDKTRAKVVFFWQLQLYTALVLNLDPYPVCFELLRNINPPSDTPSKQLNFYKYFCDAAQLDLTEVFEQTKFLIAYSENLDGKQITVTQAMVDAAKSYVAAKNYPKPGSSAIYYITGRTLDIYKNKTSLADSVVGAGVNISGEEANISNNVWSGAVAFEACNDDEVIYSSVAYTGFTTKTNTLLGFPNTANNIKAVTWDGTRKIIYQK